MPKSPPIATTAVEAYVAVNPDEALQSGDARYVSLDSARGANNLAKTLRTRIVGHEQSSSSGVHARFLVTGHRGCGKTTELYRLKELLTEEHFAVVYFDAESELNLQDLKWWNILIEMVWQIDEQLSKFPFNLAIPNQLLDDATEWIARTVTQKTERTAMEASLATEFGVSTGLPFFAKAKAAIRALVKGSSETIKKIESEAERRPTQLYEAVAAVVSHVRKELYEKRGGGGVVIIVDGLEKIPFRQIEGSLTTYNSLFIHNGAHLKTPPCHLIYSLPLSLLTSEKIGEVFPSRPFIMPMLHVRHREGKEDRHALNLMAEVIRKRVSPTLFASGVIKMLALASGGHLRDFLSLVREAAGEAEENPRITQTHAKRAIAAQIDLYNRTILQEFIEPLDYVAQHNQLSGGPLDGELVSHLLVLKYRNNEAWTRLHPCVSEAPRCVRAPRASKEEISSS
ncbi:MAG: hypothetical protein HY267_07645 [Deltaproteobacteria bacterium]|nr:hypothetical protein [Deltaproteobacteria bacterium]